MSYAKDTSVSVEKSRGEIERTLSRYGAIGFSYAWQGTYAVIQFIADERRIRFVLPLPDRNDEKFWITEGRKIKRTAGAAEAEWEQACRQKWRALSLCIKAKLESVSAGIATFEDEFMANIMLPNGQTVGDAMRPQIAISYQKNEMPPLLGFSK
jgi:hypothetical protein